MTGLGEEVYTAPGGDGVEAMVEAAAQHIAASHTDRFDDMALVRNDASAALESLGIPLEVLAELKAGVRKAVRVTTFTLPSGREGCIPSLYDVFGEGPRDDRR